uniref:Uncharacterized protein n=1 Tax=Plectus sambesii TaxID=2011161 RepID=A0A914V5T8_9BILA
MLLYLMKKYLNGAKYRHIMVIHLRNGISETYMKIFVNPMKNLRNGVDKLPNKEQNLHNFSLVSGMKKVMVYRNLMKKLSNGTENQQNKDMNVRKLTWELCMKMVEVCLNQMKKLPNGTENQQNKEI